MKNSKLILILASLALLGAGCAKEMKATDPAAPAVAAPPVVNPTFPVNAPPGQGVSSAGNNWAYGSSATLSPDSLDIFNTYVGTHPLNNPTNVKLNVNVVDVGGGHFGGQVKIAYDDAGQHYEGYFVAGTGTNQSYPSYGTNQDVGLYHAQYNYWFNNGKNFSGYFQDAYGAIVLVIDSVMNQADAQGSAYVGGSIWFKNFAKTLAPQGTERYCWFIYSGPYDCRSVTVMDKSNPLPSDGYRRLGTFTGLSKSKAFNQ
ncbi:MAG: hypothetical protein ACXWRA_10045 [Pseudobdellovibrionaceae bacterium]